MERWSGRVALVTGASAGIGAGIASALVQHGMHVAGLARRDDKVKALAEELRESCAPGSLHAFKVDLTKDVEVMAAVAWVKETLGGIDVLVNNAGIVLIAPLTGEGESAVPTWRTLLDLNTVAPSTLMREAVLDMRARGVDDGHIVNIGSVAGQNVTNFPGGYVYMGSKYASQVMSDGLRHELNKLGTKIRVTSVSPGLVRTEWWVTSGLPQDYSEALYQSSPSLEVDDVVSAVLYALACPAHVQINQITILPTGSKI